MYIDTSTTHLCIALNRLCQDGKWSRGKFFFLPLCQFFRCHFRFWFPIQEFKNHNGVKEGNKMQYCVIYAKVAIVMERGAPLVSSLKSRQKSLPSLELC